MPTIEQAISDIPVCEEWRTAFFRDLHGEGEFRQDFMDHANECAKCHEAIETLLKLCDEDYSEC